MNILAEQKKYFTITELIDSGYSYYKIKKMEEEGKISRINRSTYENLTYKGEENDFYSAEAYVPDGVICLMSAARYYNLTNFLPNAVDVAIQRKKKASTLPEWPEIKIHYFDTSRIEIGITKVQEGGNCFHIFDIEKTVADIIYYRNKVGIEETIEILKNYVKDQNRQIDKLYDYAKKLRCEKATRMYMEVLLL